MADTDVRAVSRSASGAAAGSIALNTTQRGAGLRTAGL